MARNGPPDQPPPTIRDWIVAALWIVAFSALLIGGILQIHSDVMQAINQ